MSAIFPVVAAGIAHFVIGHAWYHPRVFGAAWMRMNRVTPEMVERGKSHGIVLSLGGLVTGLLAASALLYFMRSLAIIDAEGAIELALIVWTGFAAPALFGQVLWDHKPLDFCLINTGYWLVSFIVMSLILLF